MIENSTFPKNPLWVTSILIVEYSILEQTLIQLLSIQYVRDIVIIQGLFLFIFPFKESGIKC